MKFQHHHQCQFSKERTVKKCLLLLLAASSLTQAATFNVSTVSELEDALTISRTNGEADTIVISEGTYFVSSSAFNRLNLGDSDNELTIEGDSNLNPEKIIFDGATTNYLFFVSNPSHKISIKNLTIQNAVEPIFIGGNNTHPVEILNVNFLNNTDSAIYHGGSSSSDIKQLIIKNSIFNNNSGDSYGGAIASMNLLVDNSRFENNTAPDGGGAIHCFNSSSPYNCSIYNSEFLGNSSSVGSPNGINDIWGAGNILNSIFDGLGSSSPSQPSVRLNNSGSLLIANNLFINNEQNLYFVNSNAFLINNVLNSIDAGIGANLYHNIFTQVEPSMSSGAWADVSNTYNSSISFDANYKTTAYDLVVGKGYDPLVLDEFKNNQLLIDAMQTDYEGSPRTLGTIDIGQIEYDVDTSPQITNMTYEGNAKIYNELTIIFDIQYFSDRTLSHVYFDAGDGIYYEIYENQEQVTFESAGDFTIYVKAIDSEGEETIRGLNITIADFTTEEAFQYVQNNLTEFSLVTESAQATAVASATSTGIAAGKQYVQNNLTEFSLVTESAQATAVASAISTGIAAGKQYVQDNLTEFSLVTESAQATAVTAATTTGIATGKLYVQDNLSEFSLVTEAAQATAVSASNTSGIATGKQYVQDNLSEFSLVTEAAQATAITAAATSGIASGKQYVQDNLTEFSLVTEAAQATAVTAAATSGIASGKQYVQDNLTEFSLVTEAAQATAVASASATGIADGENNVINNPLAYRLNIVVGLSKEGIAQLPTGWKMISIPEDVTDLSIFDGAKIVWFFNNETQAWTGYSSNSNTVQQMEDKSIGIITSLSAGDGVFIEM
jgi:hypothetical protein